MVMKNFTDTLNYIKSRLAQQQIELSDKEILTFLQNHTLPEFSVYVPRREDVLIDTVYCIDETIGAFDVPVDNKDEIIDIYEWYPATDVNNLSVPSSGIFGAFGSILGGLTGAASNNLPIYEPIYDPNKQLIIFNARLSEIEFLFPVRFILSMIHKTPNTIPTEIYYRFWKPFAYADILINIGTIRSKFQNLNTPIGQIVTNYEQLISEGQQIKQEIIERLRTVWTGIPAIITL